MLTNSVTPYGMNFLVRGRQREAAKYQGPRYRVLWRFAHDETTEVVTSFIPGGGQQSVRDVDGWHLLMTMSFPSPFAHEVTQSSSRFCLPFVVVVCNCAQLFITGNTGYSSQPHK